MPTKRHSLAAVSEARTGPPTHPGGLAGLLFTIELMVSELLTNAIRYGRPPVELRLIRHDVLVCEVTDSSSTQPRLRRARTTDEGGCGLFLVAQLGARWGCRHPNARAFSAIRTRLAFPPPERGFTIRYGRRAAAAGRNAFSVMASADRPRSSAGAPHSHRRRHSCRYRAHC
ncbi:ATP-binding protein [Streptomyces sp. NBC_01602]|uniref:ATP-binding protein n=1 Tax=Streptomyces sp. NBC_01602 TaxID=2975893 RepID=UPI00386B2C90